MDASKPADLALVGGDVYCVDAVGRWAQAVAVRGGRVVAVGSDEQIRDHVGPKTETIDLRGKMVLPGFQDAHVHPTGGGMDRLRCDLSAVHSLEAYLELIRAYADGHPEAVRGGRGHAWGTARGPGGQPSHASGRSRPARRDRDARRSRAHHRARPRGTALAPLPARLISEDRELSAPRQRKPSRGSARRSDPAARSS